MELTDLLHQLRLQVWQIRLELWQQTFLTYSWWFIAVTIAASYAIWWKLVDKRRIIELLLYGSFIAVSRIIYDNWGISSGRWTYITDLVPIGYSLFLNDLTVIPLALMLVHQYSPDWARFFIWMVVVQGAISFIFWPYIANLGILQVHNWKLYYSFLVMLFIATTMRAILIFGLNVQRKSRLTYPESSPTLLVPEPAMKPLDEEAEREDGGRGPAGKGK